MPILLPGNMCDSRVWVDIVRASLGQALDADLAQDDSILAMAKRALSATGGKLVPVGFSMGGIVALAMAFLAPERIAGMVLLDTNASADRPERAAVRPRQQTDSRNGLLERVVVQELIPHYLAPCHQSDEPMLALLRDMARTLGVETFVRQSEALRTRPDLSHVLTRLDVPVFIACGLEDRLCPPVLHEVMAQSTAQSTLHVFPDAGHMLPLEQPAALAKALAQWRAALPRPF